MVRRSVKPSGALIVALALVFAATLATARPGAAHTCGSTNYGYFYSGPNLTDYPFHVCHGESFNLADYGFDNVISSYKVNNAVGKGFILWTGVYGGSAHKVCGSATRNTMPPGFDNTVSSIQSTTSCPT